MGTQIIGEFLSRGAERDQVGRLRRMLGVSVITEPAVLPSGSSWAPQNALFGSSKCEKLFADQRIRVATMTPSSIRKSIERGVS